MSVLIDAADAGHTGRIVLLASYRTEDEALFRPEMAVLRQRLPGLEVAVFVTAQAGRIGVDALRPHAGPGSRAHLCGPAGMMQDLIGHLVELGVPRESVRTEAFVSGRSRETRRERSHAIALAAAATGRTEFTITMTGSDPTFPCRPGQSILDAANAADVPLPQSCGEAPAAPAGYACSPATTRPTPGACSPPTNWPSAGGWPARPCPPRTCTSLDRPPGHGTRPPGTRRSIMTGCRARRPRSAIAYGHRAGPPA
ncbi:hypothetical protein NKG94_00775 [Micromonospora sp. M12]